MRIIVTFLLLLICGLVSAQRPLVNIPGMGMVEGKNERSTMNNNKFFSFRGIPFAKPPSGPLRFKAPVAPDPWEGILNANTWGEVCPQSGPVGTKTADEDLSYWQRLHMHFGDNSTHQAASEMIDKDLEDCLYINVYTKSIDPDANLPVMIFYHGGSFNLGGSYIYYPDFFMDHDIVLVVPHYRLGTLGFLSMQNEEIPGNAGMLDQVFALEWIRDYIHVFGGDKNQVTAMGESAGGASVSLLALSPLTKDLFNRIIGMSGAALAEWALDRDPLYNARGIAQILNCNMTDDDTITQCFIDVKDPGYLYDALKQWSIAQRKVGRNGFGGSTPVVQKTGRIFLDKNPEDIWKDPNFVSVPAMYGAVKHEGTFVMKLVYEDYIQANDLLEDESFMKYDILKPFLGMFGIGDTAYSVSDAVEMEYIGIERMGNITAMAPGLIDFGGATFLKAPGYQSMIKHSKFGNSYWYIYNYYGSLSPGIGFIVIGNDLPFPPGICHGADIPMLFGIPGLYGAMSSEERNLARQMTHMWVNFAIYGNPTPEESPVEGVPLWPAYDPINEYYMRLDKNLEIASDFTLEYSIAKDENFGL